MMFLLVVLPTLAELAGFYYGHASTIATLNVRDDCVSCGRVLPINDANNI